MPKLPVGVHRRKGRPGYYLRLYRDGKDRRFALGEDYTQAMEKAEELRASEGPLVANRVTVAEAAARWLESYVRLRRTAKGLKLTKRRVELYLVPFMGHMQLAKVTREDVRAYRAWLERTTALKVATVSHVLTDCRCFLLWCEDAELIERHPFPRRLMPKLPERRPDRVTDEEAERMKALPEPYGFVCRLALGTGLRWGELCRAQASDVERGFLLIEHTKSRKVRRVPLAEELLAEVRLHVGRLVPFAAGSPGSFARAVRRRTGMERFHVHQMRHTFGCQWMDRGGNLGALQQILGHASITTTQRYARMSDEMVMREAERIATM